METCNEYSKDAWFKKYFNTNKVWENPEDID
jgi:hypothetical protein